MDSTETTRSLFFHVGDEQESQFDSVMGNMRTIAGDLVKWDEWSKQQIEERGYNSKFVTQATFPLQFNRITFLTKV